MYDGLQLGPLIAYKFTGHAMHMAQRRHLASAFYLCVFSPLHSRNLQGGRTDVPCTWKPCTADMYSHPPTPAF